MLEEVDQVDARAHRGGAVGGAAVGVAVTGGPAQALGLEAVLDLPAVGEMQGEALAGQVGQLRQDERLGGEALGQGAYGDPVGLGAHGDILGC
ncbi:hypothetical protein D3C75_1152320 [compost metagenome]